MGAKSLKPKLRPEKCANPSCNKWLRIQKLWCSIECQIVWEKKWKKKEDAWWRGALGKF